MSNDVETAVGFIGFGDQGLSDPMGSSTRTQSL